MKSAMHFVQSEEKSSQPCVPLICSAVWTSLGECATAKSATLSYWGREGLSGREGSASEPPLLITDQLWKLGREECWLLVGQSSHLSTKLAE